MFSESKPVIGIVIGIFVLISAALVASTLYAVETTDPIDELVKNQEGLRSVSAAFAQENYDALLGRPIKRTGKFYFKSDKGVRWEYDDALVIYDGNMLYVYSPETSEAEKIKGKRGFMGPLAFDVKALREEYDIRGERADGDIRITLRPKTEMPFASMSMIFPAGKAFPAEVTVVQETGDEAVIKFSSVKINPNIQDGMFVFSPPPGTEIRERDFE